MSITKIAAHGTRLRIGTATASITGIVQTSGTATATSAAAHGLSTGDLVVISGAAQADYNGIKQITVATGTTFTFAVPTGATTPATGTIIFLAPSVEFLGLKTIAPNLGEREMIDVTTHDSTTTKQYIPAKLRDTVSFEITASYDPAAAAHEALRAAHAAGTTIVATFILPDAGAAQWSTLCVITALGIPELDPETSDLQQTFTLKATGTDYFTA